MKTVAYLRVSKDTQDVNNQRLAVLQFAQRERIQVDQFMEVTVSSRKSAKDRRIDMLLEQLREGDTLIVSELSRMGRSSPLWIRWLRSGSASWRLKRGFV